MTDQISPQPSSHEQSHHRLAEISDSHEVQQSRGWKVEINGVVIESPITSARIFSPNMGVEVNYGMGSRVDTENPSQRTQTYDTVEVIELGGGGAVTVPYAILDGKLMFGVVVQEREKAGGFIEEIPRGFLNKDETHADAAIREMAEETGLKAMKSRFVKIGEGINPNSTFFNTAGANSSGSPRGISFYGLQILPEELEKIVPPDGRAHYQFIQTIRDEAEGDKSTERILSSKFIPVQEVNETPDALTIVGVGLLTGRMLGSQILRFAEVEVG